MATTFVSSKISIPISVLSIVHITSFTTTIKTKKAIEKSGFNGFIFSQQNTD